MEEFENIDLLIARYLRQETSPPEEAQLMHWLQSDPAHQKQFDDLLQIWQGTGALAGAPAFDVRAGWKSVEEKIRIQENLPSEPRQFILFRMSGLVAASIIGLLLISGITYYILHREKPDFITLAARDSNLPIRLPDGSRVTLRKGSLLKYRQPFNVYDRTVELSGEAFFEIVHDSRMAFLIRTSHAVIEDIGTSFMVREASDRDIIYVKSGRVRLSERKDATNELFLEAGQEATLVGRVFEKQSLTNNNYLSWENGILEFNQAPLSIVIADLSHHFQIPIDLSDSLAMKSSTITVTYKFEKSSLSEVLDEIQLTTGLRVQNKNNHILFY